MHSVKLHRRDQNQALYCWFCLQLWKWLHHHPAEKEKPLSLEQMLTAACSVYNKSV